MSTTSAMGWLGAAAIATALVASPGAPGPGAPSVSAATPPASAAATQPIPPPLVSATPQGTTVSWDEAGRGALGFTVDVGPGDWNGGFWHKAVPPGTTSTDAPGGFVAYNGATGPLALQAGTTYSLRVYYPATGDESPTVTFVAVATAGPGAIAPPLIATSANGVTVSWNDSGRGALGFTVDIDDDGDWNDGFWHKSVPPGTTSTSGPDGFVPYNGATVPLAFQPDATYSVRVFYPATGEESPVATFTVPKLTGVIGFTLGFAVRGFDPTWREAPLYPDYDARDPGWWDATVDDAVHAGADFVAPVNRGHNPNGDAVGNGDPSDLGPLVTSLARYAVGKPRVALFVDTGGAFTITKNLAKHRSYSTTPAFDWADQDGSGEGGWQYFWDDDISIFYDTIPGDRLFLYNGRPLIYFWSAASAWYTNQQGNLSRFLRYVRANVQAKIGLDPFIVVDRSWVDTDTTIQPGDADGVDDWFDPTVAAYTIRDWGGTRCAVSVPGFQDNSGSSLQRTLPRNGGDTLRNALQAIQQAGTNLTLLEGLTDVEESCGYYRSNAPDWNGNPDLYLDIVKSFTTP